MNIFKNKNKTYLLPYIREDISGNYDQIQQKGWEIKKLEVDKQWGYSQGENVVVAVLDTGCDIKHPDIKNNIALYESFTKFDSFDVIGHGTHVIGTICANNNNIGMIGVAPKTKIISGKVLGDNGNGTMQSVAEGIYWAVDNHADIITMSLGCRSYAKVVEEALEHAYKKNITCFVAAGNDGKNKPINYPASSDYSIAVGAIDENFSRTPFTCSGDELDFLAPGQDIFSTVPGGYAMMSGTSMSNPFVAGCAALLCSYAKFKGKKLNMYNYLDIMSTGTKKLKGLHNIKKLQGHGIINPAEFNKWMSIVDTL
jgi:subtilisin family serine protease